jgi:hypothetical protein
MMLQVEDCLEPPSRPTGAEAPRHKVSPREHPDAGALVDGAGTHRAGGDVADLIEPSRLLASRWIAGLDNRPFAPTADQLAWVWGGKLVRGEARTSRARIAAGRYAALFTDHVIGDITIDGAPGAYARIWLCARLAFIESVTAEPSEPPSDGALSAWEYEGGGTS